MKRTLYTILLVFFISLIPLLSQYELRNLPYFLDKEWQNKPADYVRTAHLKPYPMPAYAYKIAPGKPKIQTQSGIELINISKAASHQSENYININPRDPNNIVVGSNDYRYINDRMVAFYSTDAGSTWKESTTPSNLGLGYIGLPPSGGGCTTVDPGVSFDSEGNVYYVYLFAQMPSDNTKGDTGIFVAMSRDNGKTWAKNDVGVPVIKYESQLQDKCFIAVDSDPSSPFKNRTYVVWTDFDAFAVGFAYAEGDLNFNSSTSVQGSSGKSIQSPLPVVGPDGVLYITWEEKTDNGSRTRAVVQKSTNGGVSWAWGTPKVAQVVNTSGEIIGTRRAFATKGEMRISSHPMMDVDLRNGNLYVVQGGRDENSKYGVYLSKSTNKGETWSAPSKVENLKKIDGNTTGNDVFLPSIAVDPVSGMIAVLYYSSENDPANNKGCDAFVAISFDEGKTFSHIQLTDTWYFQNNSVVDAGGDNLGRYWGDYTSIDAYNGNIYPCFWMPTAANADFWSCDLFTAKLSTGPEAPTELAFQNSWEEPSKVTLTWKDPDKNKLGGPIGDFKIYILKGNTKIGEVNKGVQQFIDNSVVMGEQFSYSVKVHIIATGEESNLATIYGTAGGVLEPKQPKDIIPRSNETGILLSWTNPVEHVDNTYLQDLEAIDIYINDTLNTSVQKPSIQAGDGSSVQLILPTEKFYSLKMKARTLRGTGTGESAFTEEIIAYAGTPLQVMDENFDDTNNITPHYISAGWGLTDKAFASTPNCMTDSPDASYKPNTDTRTIFPPVIVQPGAATLQITHMALMEKNDYGKIKISNDFGATYKSISWLNVNRFSGWDKSLYKVENSQWFVDGFDLSEFEGDTVMAMFEFESDQFNNKDGWYIDDFKVGDFPVGNQEYKDLSNSLGAMLYPNPVEDEAMLEFSLPIGGNAHISIYDEMGRIIKVIENKELIPGEYKYNINTSEFLNNIYYIRININGQNDIVPMIIRK